MDISNRSSNSLTTAAVKSYDYSLFGEVEEKPLSNIRKQIANNMATSWAHIPHVTHHDEVDISEIEILRKELNAHSENSAQDGTKEAVHYTLMPFILRGFINALKAYPEFNASISDDIQSIIIKHYYHIGVAVDTSEGLIVPVIKNADSMSFEDLSIAINDVAKRARKGNLTMKDIEGGSCSVTSLGLIGGTGFTPIIKSPEVAILGVSRIIEKVVPRDDAMVIKSMLPLSLSYDHRVIDGVMAARFMTHLRENLEKPNNLLNGD